MMKLQYVCILLLFLCVTTLAEVSVSVFTQPAQVASQLYLIEFVKPFMQHPVYRFVDYSFSPLGKTEVDSESGAAKCAFGRNECRVSLLQYCAYKTMSPKASINFLICVQSHIDQLDLWGYQCASDTYQNWRAIKECVRDEFNTFKKMYVERYTIHAGPIDHYPAVFINNQLCPGECRDLMQRICLAHGKKMPEPCKSILTEELSGNTLVSSYHKPDAETAFLKSQFTPSQSTFTDSQDSMTSSSVTSSLDITTKKRSFSGEVPDEYKIPLTLFTDFSSTETIILLKKIYNIIVQDSNMSPWFKIRIVPTLSPKINVLGHKNVMCNPKDKTCLYFLYSLCITELTYSPGPQIHLLRCVLHKNAFDGNNVRMCDKVNISIKHFNYCVNMNIHNDILEKYNTFASKYYHGDEGDSLPLLIIGNSSCRSPCEHFEDKVTEIQKLYKQLYESETTPSAYENANKQQLSTIQNSDFGLYDKQVLGSKIKMEYIENMYITKDAQRILDDQEPKNRYKIIPKVHTDPLPGKGKEGSKKSSSSSQVLSSMSSNAFDASMKKQGNINGFETQPILDQNSMSTLLQNSEFYQNQVHEKKKKKEIDVDKEFSRLQSKKNEEASSENQNNDSDDDHISQKKKDESETSKETTSKSTENSTSQEEESTSDVKIIHSKSSGKKNVKNSSEDDDEDDDSIQTFTKGKHTTPSTEGGEDGLLIHTKPKSNENANNENTQTISTKPKEETEHDNNSIHHVITKKSNLRKVSFAVLNDDDDEEEEDKSKTVQQGTQNGKVLKTTLENAALLLDNMVQSEVIAKQSQGDTLGGMRKDGSNNTKDYQSILHDEIVNLKHADNKTLEEYYSKFQNYQHYETAIFPSINHLFMSFDHYPKPVDYSHVDYIQNIYSKTPIRYSQRKIVIILYDIFNRNILSYVNGISELFQDLNQTDIYFTLIPLENMNIDREKVSTSNPFTYTNSYNNIIEPQDVHTELINSYFCSLDNVRDPLVRWIFSLCLLKKGLLSTDKVHECLTLIDMNTEENRKAIEKCAANPTTVNSVRNLILIRNRLFFYSNDPNYQSINRRLPLVSLDGHIFTLSQNDDLLALCDYFVDQSIHFCRQGKHFKAGIANPKFSANSFSIDLFEENNKKPRIDIYIDPSCSESSKLLSVVLNLLMRKQNVENVLDIHIHPLNVYHLNFFVLKNSPSLPVVLNNHTICNNIGVPCFSTQLYSCMIATFPNIHKYWSFYRCVSSFHKFDFEYLEYCAYGNGIDLTNVYNCMQLGRGKTLIIEELSNLVNNHIVLHTLPTILINNEILRNINSFFNTVCSSYSTPPSWCDYLSSPLSIKECTNSPII